MSEKTKALVGNIISAAVEIIVAVIALIAGAPPAWVAVGIVLIGALCQALGIQFLAPPAIESKKDAWANIISGAAEAVVAGVTLGAGVAPPWMAVAIVVIGAICQALGVKFIPPKTEG